MDTNTPDSVQAPGGHGDAHGVTTLLAWDAPTMARHERSPRWYIIGGLIVVAAAAYGIIGGNWTLTIIALLIGGMYFLLRDAQPPLKHISFTTHGVYFDGAFTRWDDCTGFWIVSVSEHTRLFIGRKNRRQATISIFIENVDLSAVRWTLSQFLSEETDRGESALDAIIRICKL